MPHREPYTQLTGLLAGLPEPERGRAVLALEAMRAAADRTEDELREIAYVASHDLTEPLRMVTSYLQLLERRAGGDLDELSREFMFYAVDGAERMKALIDDLLRYSRVGTAGLTTAPVDLGALLVEVLRDLGPAIDEAGAQVQVADGLPPVRADRVQLGQLLQNLVANAVKFRPEDRGNHVTITAHAVPGAPAVQIAVADDGIGVDPGQAERIWRVFQRLHHREEYAGNGIGLAICRRIVERHGGTIRHEDRPGGGSVFVVRLPDVDPGEEG